LNEANLSFSNVRDADFRNASLKRINLTRADRTGALISKWKLKKAFIAGDIAYQS